MASERQTGTEDTRQQPAGWFVRIVDVFAWIGVLALMVPVVLVCADIIWRRAVGGAFVDVYDIAKFGLVFVACWSIPYGFVHGNHVSVDLLPLPARLQHWITVMKYLVSAALFMLLTWFAWHGAMLHYRYQDITQNLGIPVIYYWIVFLVGLVLAILACLWRAGKAMGARSATSGSGQ